MKKLLWICLLCVSACGFSPLYKTQNGKTTDLTARIQIAPIANYEGYLMENYLSDALNPDKIGGQKQYELTVSLNAPTISEQNIQDDNFSSRERMTLTAKYRLINKTTEHVLVDSTTSATGAYNIATEPYATWMAQKKTKENLIKMLSERITIHVISFVKKEAEYEG